MANPIARSLSSFLIALACCLLPAVGFSEDSLRDIIDRQIEAKHREKQVQAAGPASDAEFLRRVYLDLVGDIPTADEAAAFIDSDNDAKRAALIDRLLSDQRFANHQADVWELMLFTRNSPGNYADNRAGVHAWLTKQFAENRPYNQWARDLLRAEGTTVEQGPPTFLAQFSQKPEDAAEAITQRFLGVQLQCARCHDHPFEPWTQLDFYGTAAFFARLRVVSMGKKDNINSYAIGEMNRGDVLFTGPAAEQEPGKKGEPVGAKFLLGETLNEPELNESIKDPRNFPGNKLPPAPEFSRKNAFADWATAAENPFFAKAIANRIWAQFMGRGVVHPVDNMSESNDPSHPELLSQLTDAMKSNNFDLKFFIREICNSRAYQRSSAGATSESLPTWFEQARSRPLSAEELTASWRTAVSYAATNPKPSKDKYAPLNGGYVSSFFGRPTNGTGDFAGGMREHLFMNNGGMGSLFTTAKESLHWRMINSETSWEDRVDELFLATLSRYPEPAEKTAFVDYLTAEAKPHERLKEAIWSLVTCSEFRFCN